MCIRNAIIQYLLFPICCIYLCGCASVTPPPAAPGLPTSATAGDTTIVAIAPAGKSGCSVWDFLGVEQACGAIVGGKHRIRDHIASKLGMRFPGLEPIPELKLITDPANLGPDAPPTAKAAAEIKMKEDQAQQKIKGIRYLASIGCGGCYPGVEEAFLAAMEDCTEEVRYEAVLGIRKSTGRECSFCSGKACCSEKIQKKLFEMTTMGDCDCYSETSARVRRQARLALRQCGPEIRVPEDVELDENGEPVDPEELPATTPRSGEDLDEDDLRRDRQGDSDGDDDDLGNDPDADEPPDEPEPDSEDLAQNIMMRLPPVFF